jgi:hypothetical protein
MLPTTAPNRKPLGDEIADEQRAAWVAALLEGEYREGVEAPVRGGEISSSGRHAPVS